MKNYINSHEPLAIKINNWLKANTPEAISSMLTTIGKKILGVKDPLKLVDEAIATIKALEPVNGNKIFIDCGFNKCIILDKFVNSFSSKYKYYGFEIQEALVQQAQNKRDTKYKNIDINFINAAISNSNNDAKMYSEISGFSDNLEGSTIVNHKDSYKTDYSNPSIVKGIDFAEFLTNNFSKNDFIAVKIDIEGAEYDVLEHLITTNTLSMIDVLMCEFHWMFFDKNKRNQAKIRHKNLLRKLKSNPNYPKLLLWA